MRPCRKEEGKSFTKEAAMAKYYSSVIAQKAAGSAIEWAGGVGFTRETGIEKYWRDSKIASVLALRVRRQGLNYLCRHRARFMKERQTSNSALLPNSFRRNTHRVANSDVVCFLIICANERCTAFIPPTDLVFLLRAMAMGGEVSAEGRRG
jgi:hypothetical protein